MKKYIFLLLLVGTITLASAQKVVIPKKIIIENLGDTTFYPIKGNFKISESGFGIYKNLEFWVYDGKGREIYYVTQGIPTGDAMADVVYKMIDREYTEFMMKHGQVLNHKRFGVL